MEPIDENEECVANEIVNSESYVADLEVKNHEEPYIGMEFELQEDAYSFYAYSFYATEGMRKLVARRKILEII